MASEKFTLTKERLVDWLSNDSYMEKYRSQVYKSILRFYFDTFFTEIYPAERAILEIEKDLGMELDREALLKLFYFDYWSRKKKKERARQQSVPAQEIIKERNVDIEQSEAAEPGIPAANPDTVTHKQDSKSNKIPQSPRFEFRDAKEIVPNKKPLYVGKKQRQQQSGEGPESTSSDT